MELFANLTYRHPPLPLTLNPHRPSFSPTPKTPSPSVRLAITASIPQNHKTLKTLAAVKTTAVAAVTAAVLLLSRLTLKPALASVPVPTPVTTDSTGAVLEQENAVADRENEVKLEKYLAEKPDDVEALRNLMELKVKGQKVNEAIGIVEKLIRLEPDEQEWPLMKAHMHSFSGDQELAKIGFNEILGKDPLRVEAYHGLVISASEAEELREVEKRVVKAMEECKKADKNDDLRDFKLLFAQIKVIEGDYDGALKIYEEIVSEEPRDYRPYLCQGIVYTLLKKSDVAEKSFEMYRKLVPKGHPYGQYFEDNLIATKLFAQKVENERAYSKS